MITHISVCITYADRGAHSHLLLGPVVWYCVFWYKWKCTSLPRVISYVHVPFRLWNLSQQIPVKHWCKHSSLSSGTEWALPNKLGLPLFLIRQKQFMAPAHSVQNTLVISHSATYRQQPVNNFLPVISALLIEWTFISPSHSTFMHCWDFFLIIGLNATVWSFTAYELTELQIHV